jgi:SanA protein
MASEAPASWRRLVVRRVLLPAVLLGLAVVGAGNAYLFATTADEIAASVDAAPERPVAIVLGNTVFPNGHLSRVLTERVATALALYKAGKVQRIVVSGAVRPSDDYDEPSAMAGWLEARGVPPSAVILDGLGHRTAATMASAASRGLRDVLICTQAYHLPRSLYFARRAGLRAIGVSAPDHDRLLFEGLRAFVREGLARPEAVIEVALRGVRVD